MAFAMLSGLVTSSGSILRRSLFGRISDRGVRIVAMTFHPLARKWRRFPGRSPMRARD